MGYLVSHPIQYQAPLFRALARSSRIDFVALFGCNFGTGRTIDPGFGRVVDFGIDLLSGYEYRFLPQAGRSRIDHFTGLRTPSLFTAWKPPEIDVLVLHGWATAMMWQAALGGRLLQRPYLLRGDTSQPPRPGRHLLSLARNVAVRTLLQGAAGVLAVGTANASFYRDMGCAAQRIHMVPYSVDDCEVAAQAHRGRRDRRHIRSEFGIDDSAYLLIGVGKLVRQKRPLDIVAALPMLPDDVHLLWVGSGSHENEVESEARRLGVSHRVHLAGFRPSPEVWRLLGAADILVFPSEREQWGLVLNEAVAAGLPILVSEECGGAQDLVVPGKTGEILPVGEVAAWSAAVRRWSQLARTGFRGDPDAQLSIARRFSLNATASEIERVVISLT